MIQGNIDAHQHFWQYDAGRDGWITDEMKLLQRNFLPPDLAPVLQQNNLEGCVVVQSDQSEKENEFQLANAAQYPFIKGVVGWVNLQAEDIENRLAYYQDFEKLKGFRHVLQGEPQRDMMLNAAFKKGIGLLNKYGFTYDILIFPDQLKYARELVAAFPDQPFVIDHLAKPYIKAKEIAAWKQDMEAVAAHKNVWCKISGMVTEAHLQHWTKEDFTPYMDAVVNAFGTNRIMFGSDWPVCLLAASYEEVKDIADGYFSAFTCSERAAFFGVTAIRFYHLT